MGILSSIRNVFTFGAAAAPLVPYRSGWDQLELRATPAYDAAPLLSRANRISAWGDEEVSSFVRDSFRIAGIIFRGGTLIADAFAESPLRVYRERDGQPEEEPTHWARELFAEPNPEQGEAEFWNTVVLVAFIHGFAYVEKVRARSGDVVQLYPRNPDTLKRRERANGHYVWEQRANGQLIRELPDEDIFHVPYQFDPSLTRRGITPVSVLGREIGIDTVLTTYLKIFLDESGIPPFIMTSKDPYADEATVDANRERWSQKMGRGSSWGAPPFLAGIEIEKVGLNMDEMAFPDLKGITELRIAQGLGIPAHLLGAKEAIQNSGLSTTEMQQAMGFFQQYTISGLRSRVDAAFTRAILREREPDRMWSLEFDTKRIKALQEDESAKQERIRANVIAGLVTLEEARPALGFEPTATIGETYLRPFSVVEVIAGSTPEPTPSALPPGKSDRQYRDLKALSPHDLQVRASSLDRNRKAQAKLTELGSRHLRRFFKEQGQRITGQLKSTPDLAVKLAVEEIDWDQELKLLEELMQRFYGEAGQLAFSDASSVLGVTIDWSLANPNVQRVVDQLGREIKGISETTRQDVARIISDSLDEGMTLDEIAGKLQGQFEETYRGRALTIARTESMRSYSTASVLGYQESGVVEEVEFSDSPTHCEDYGASDGLSCCERNGLVVKLIDAQKHIDAEHPNGSLGTLPVLTTPLGEG